MALEQTLSIIKPNAVAKDVIGKIYSRFEAANLKIVAAKMMHLKPEQAQGFYAEHAERPFFGELVEFMCSGPIVVQVLEGEDAVALNRKLMGATNPAEAEDDTIRKVFADSLSENAVHGSDSTESAAREIAFFFDKSDVFSRA